MTYTAAQLDARAQMQRFGRVTLYASCRHVSPAYALDREPFRVDATLTGDNLDRVAYYATNERLGQGHYCKSPADAVFQLVRDWGGQFISVFEENGVHASHIPPLTPDQEAAAVRNAQYMPPDAKAFQQFPDYPRDGMPALLPTFRDSSYGNDSAPSMSSDALGVWILCDYPDDSQRELPGGKRFIVFTFEDGESVDGDNTAFESDSWDSVKIWVASHAAKVPEAVKLARVFVQELRSELQYSDFQEVRRLNSTEPYSNCCASHDFCDANMPMARAFESLYGRESDVSSAADAGLWSAAWEHARATQLKA